ncbi:sensor histidine kinase [Roseateles oligotrophus]|uniref:histidine kinase n=1 Tax=Roseateles oligotrophus TaxID=1769250 RepID=A0ABT2YC06_9BURK|nr:ATP-binding protein [Roseateles oligotrophus]MCV2367385.1 GHKL domain-containing protein [Roseateles oligotrophus]
MNSLSEVRISSHRLPGWGAVLWLGLGLAVGVLCLLALLLLSRPAAGVGLLTVLLTALCTVLILLGVAGLGWHIGVRLTRQQLGDALRESRMQAQMLAQMQPHCQWASDANHRLVRWQSPRALLTSLWSGAAAPQTMWERFELVDGGADGLRKQLESGAANFDLSVSARDGGERWRLRGVACLDGQGRFSGYYGMAEALPDELPAVAPCVPVGVPNTQWMEALPGPAWLLSEEIGKADANGATVLAVNSQAAALACAEEQIGVNWANCMARLPAPLAEALAAQAVRSFVADSGNCGLVGLWRQANPVLGSAQADSSAPSRQTQQMANEHESFSYTVSHDLRAPLRVVEGFTRILKEDYGRLLDRIGNDHLDRVMGAAARMNSMIDSLLSLAQLSAQPLARQPVNLSQLAGFVVEELARATPERKVNVHIQPHMLVQGDPTLLRMVLENLLGNAWKYSGKCMQPLIRFEAQQESGHWIYRVSDNGAGFDMRFADRLFGVFQRLHSASEFQGTGVGLASVRRIVRRHGGEIWAEAVVGEGAQFYFTLAG